jgi:hypothetical protein
MEEETQVDLANVVRTVRAELAAAAAEGSDEALKFEVGPIELEFAVEIHVDRSAGGQVKLGVVTGNANRDLSTGTTHRVKVTLIPQSGGESVKIGAKAPADGDW